MSGRRALGLALMALVPGVALLRSSAPNDVFDHGEHATLFVSCASCHAGIGSGDEAVWLSIGSAECARCHDGEREDRVDWAPPESRPTNLAFSHEEHATDVEDAGLGAASCSTCHQTEGDRFMDVAAAAAQPCLDCHAGLPDREPAASHLEGSDCASCHVSVVEARSLGVARIAAFPRPADHDLPGFAGEHDVPDAEGRTACAVCHARPSCERCHLNADRVPEIAALRPDTRVAAVTAGLEGVWPEPEDHASPDFPFRHGEAGVATCATCHAASSCTTCHRDPALPWLDELPRPGPGEPEGAIVDRVRPVGHTWRFATEHAAAAGIGVPSCEACHAPAECADCHGVTNAAGGPPPTVREATDAVREADRTTWTESGFHPTGFVSRHGAEAFGVQASCSDCHSTEVFCRDCHAGLGMAVGRRGGGLGAFHDARESWLIGHGASARMGLEACASCHQPTSCLRCHSAKAGLRVNPHGSGFRAGRQSARSTISCGICHTASQIPPP